MGNDMIKRIRRLIKILRADIRQNEPAFICSHIANKSKPILLVCREGGDWQFLCGEEHENEIPIVVCIGHIFGEDKSLLDIIDLKENWIAKRESIGKKWVSEKIANPQNDTDL